MLKTAERTGWIIDKSHSTCDTNINVRFSFAQCYVYAERKNKRVIYMPDAFFASIEFDD